jgi:transposase
MSFIVEQTIKNQIYVYEVTSYWDKEKKQSHQKRVCIGKKDSITGKLIPSKSSTSLRTVLDYGNYYFLKTISDEIHLTDILQKTFPEIWREIITLAMYQISERKPLYLSEQWTGYTKTIDNIKLTSQYVSDILQTIGQSDKERMNFFESWTRFRSEKEYLVFDITSISSYSKLNDLVEFGYNRDSEKLPQINLGMLFGQKSLLPVYYSTYPGSIKDVSTLKNIIEYAKHFNMKKVQFVMDKGFYSKQNISYMLENELVFTISMPFTIKLAKTLVDSVRSTIRSFNNTIMINDDILYGQVVSIKKEYKKELSAIVYFNDKKFLQEKENLLKKIIATEELLKKKKSFREITESEYEYKKYLIIKKKGRYISITKNEKMIEEALKYKGYVVILSNQFNNVEEVIKLYRSKDCIEKSFDNLKNELDQKRLRVHSETSMCGRLFVSFIALIIYSWIDKCMKEKNLYKLFTVDEIVNEFRTIRSIKLSNDKSLLTEISKKQRELFKKFSITIPMFT